MTTEPSEPETAQISLSGADISVLTSLMQASVQESYAPSAPWIINRRIRGAFPQFDESERRQLLAAMALWPETGTHRIETGAGEAEWSILCRSYGTHAAELLYMLDRPRDWLTYNLDPVWRDDQSELLLSWAIVRMDRAEFEFELEPGSVVRLVSKVLRRVATIISDHDAESALAEEDVEALREATQALSRLVAQGDDRSDK